MLMRVTEKIGQYLLEPRLVTVDPQGNWKIELERLLLILERSVDCGYCARDRQSQIERLTVQRVSSSLELIQC